MLLEIIWGQETTPVDLADGMVQVGGSATDDIHLKGLPYGLLRLTIEGERVTVTSIRSVRIGAVLFPARVPRLLVPGEALRLPNDVILRRAVDTQRIEARKAAETAVVVKELLAGALGPEQTRAATLTCVTGTDRGAVFPVAFSESIIGRADDSDIRVRDRAASRRHASLQRLGRRYLLKDLSATNGVYLNGVRLQLPRELTSGDVIELGQTMLRFDGPERAPEEVTSHSPAPAPAPAPPPRTAEDAFEPEPPSRHGTLDVALISMGALLAVVGMVVTVLMLR